MAKYEWTMYQIKGRLIMLSCIEISFATYLFSIVEKFWVKPGFPFTQLNRANTQNLEKKIILTCFTKIIADQSSSMAKYEWTMYQIKGD